VRPCSPTTRPARCKRSIADSPASQVPCRCAGVLNRPARLTALQRHSTDAFAVATKRLHHRRRVDVFLAHAQAASPCSQPSLWRRLASSCRTGAASCIALRAGTIRNHRLRDHRPAAATASGSRKLPPGDVSGNIILEIAVTASRRPFDAHGLICRATHFWAPTTTAFEISWRTRIGDDGTFGARHRIERHQAGPSAFRSLRQAIKTAFRAGNVHRARHPQSATAILRVAAFGRLQLPDHRQQRLQCPPRSRCIFRFSVRGRGDRQHTVTAPRSPSSVCNFQRGGRIAGRAGSPSNPHLAPKLPQSAPRPTTDCRHRHLCRGPHPSLTAT